MKGSSVVVLLLAPSVGCVARAPLGSPALTAAAPAGSETRAEARPDKRAFEIADVYATVQVGSPAIAPDGKRIAFHVRRFDLEADESWSEIWLMDADGSRQRQMSRGRHMDTDPQFSPDGSKLLFVSNREGASQLFLMPVDGGEPRALTRFPPGVSDPLFSPDGRWIAVSAEVDPERGIGPEAHRENEGKLSVHVADELLYRHWSSWRDGRVTHVLLVDAGTGEVVRDLTPGSFDSPTFSLGGERGYDFSPDGRELCFVSNHDPRQAESTNADLWSVSLEGDGSSASPRNLTEANDGWDGAPLYSPDGRSIAFISQETPGYESDLRRLAVLDRASGQVRYFTGRDDFNDWVDDVRWSPDGRTLVFQVQHQGRNPIFCVPFKGGEPTVVLTHATIDSWELTPDGYRLVYARRAVAEPHEIFSVEVERGSTPTRLTSFNAALEAEVDLRPVEELWVDGEDGNRIHAFLVKPHGFDPSRRYPLILNVHGGPQQQWTDAYRGDWQVYPGKGYVVAFANPTGSTGYGQDFCDAIRGDYGGRVFRDLMQVTDALAELPFVDPERMGAMGWSFGGYMMMWFQGHTDRFRCQAAMMGIYDLRSFYGATEELWFPERDLLGVPWESEAYEKWSPSNHVEDFRTPALVITGELDYRCPYTQSLQYFTALQKRGIPSRLIVYPNAGHWPSWREMAFYYNAHLDWFHRWLGGEPALHDVQEWARNKGWPRTEAESPASE